jgi:hypothetical protein
LPRVGFAYTPQSNEWEWRTLFPLQVVIIPFNDWRKPFDMTFVCQWHPSAPYSADQTFGRSAVLRQLIPELFMSFEFYATVSPHSDPLPFNPMTKTADIELCHGLFLWKGDT